MQMRGLIFSVDEPTVGAAAKTTRRSTSPGSRPVPRSGSPGRARVEPGRRGSEPGARNTSPGLYGSEPQQRNAEPGTQRSKPVVRSGSPGGGGAEPGHGSKEPGGNRVEGMEGWCVVFFFQYINFNFE